MSATNTASDSQHDQGARLASAVERVIRPFIRMIVGRVSCGFLVQQIKRIYIEEARRWIEKNDPHGRVTKSKLAMLSGLDTRTISAIENQGANPEDCTVGDLCAEAGVLYRWISSSEFQSESGDAILLPIMGKSRSFQSLVSSTVGRNVTYQTVLERLLESGNVEVENEDYVRLVNPYYQPVKSSQQTIIDAGSLSVGRLTETIEYNLNRGPDASRMLQQDRWSRKIPRDKFNELNNRMREIIAHQILEVENIIDDYEVDENESDVCTFGVGWFVFGDKPPIDMPYTIKQKESLK
ncbi:MAG: hypothetical protein KGY53_11870 [Wenzhouxiangellaceae bacterium]|nr:hypothetical protein [Wenzhouxiangellaceae bacterium]